MQALKTDFANLTLNGSDLTAMAQQTMAANLGVGKGINSGLAISAGTGLHVDVAPGVFTAQVQTDVPTGFSVLVPVSYTGHLFLQATVDGSFPPDALYQPTDTDPGSTYVRLGYFETGASTVTLVDTSQAQIYGGASVADFLAAPATNYFGGDIDVGGSLLVAGHLVTPFNEQTLSATLQLSANSPNTQWLKTASANRNVKLPANADITPGHSFEIYNAGNPATPSENHNLVLQDSSGTAITGGTIPPGSMTTIRPIPDASGDPAWPATATVIAY